MRALCMSFSHHLPPRKHGHCLVVHGRLLVWGMGGCWLRLVPEHCHVALCRCEYTVAWGEWYCKEGRKLSQIALFIDHIVLNLH